MIHKVNILLLDGPSSCGKTRTIRAMGATPKNTMTSDMLITELVQIAAKNQHIQEAADNLSHIRFLENLETLAGQPHTQLLAARLVMAMAKNHPIIITGICFQSRLPFFLKELKTYQCLRYRKEKVKPPFLCAIPRPYAGFAQPPKK